MTLALLLLLLCGFKPFHKLSHLIWWAAALRVRSCSLPLSVCSVSRPSRARHMSSDRSADRSLRSALSERSFVFISLFRFRPDAHTHIPQKRAIRVLLCVQPCAHVIRRVLTHTYSAVADGWERRLAPGCSSQPCRRSEDHRADNSKNNGRKFTAMVCVRRVLDRGTSGYV